MSQRIRQHLRVPGGMSQRVWQRYDGPDRYTRCVWMAYRVKKEEKIYGTLG